MFGNREVRVTRSLLEIDAMPKGPTLSAIPPLRRDAGGAVYLIDEGKKRWFYDGDAFNRYNFAWDRVVGMEVGGYPDGPAIKL